jgi:trk system potassium uptake protein TrkA
MYIVLAGGGKVGANLMRSLIGMGHEVTLIEQRRDRLDQLEQEFEHQVVAGDATEIFVLEQAGLGRPPDILVAATGDDEDNIIICQLAREKYGVPKVVARVNDPRNQEHFDLLGIGPTVCATSSLLALVEHEVPEHGLVHLVELRKENLEIVEVQIDQRSPCLGKRISGVALPDGAQLIAVVRDGEARLGDGDLTLESGDQVLGLLQRGREEELRHALLGR